jgi:hypothetical protein
MKKRNSMKNVLNLTASKAGSDLSSTSKFVSGKLEEQ